MATTVASYTDTNHRLCIDVSVKLSPYEVDSNDDYWGVIETVLDEARKGIASAMIADKQRLDTLRFEKD